MADDFDALDAYSAAAVKVAESVGEVLVDAMGTETGVVKSMNLRGDPAGQMYRLETTGSHLEERVGQTAWKEA